MIYGTKVRLRSKTLADAPEDYIWQSDPNLAHLDAVSPLKLSLPEYILVYSGELRHNSRTRRQFAIDTLDGKHIGNCTYYSIDEAEGEAELGIMIGNREYWDKGYGSDAVNALLDYIFLETRLNRVHLKTLATNIRAQKCFQKCGFSSYGRRIRENFDFVLMEIDRKQWEKLRQKSDGTRLEQTSFLSNYEGVKMVDSGKKGTLVQCDFDGTITIEDQAFLLLDAFADGDWRQLLAQYHAGKISVGDFNTRAFAMIKSDRQTLVDFVKQTVKLRPGFHELVSSCRKNGFKLVIGSNGLDFYIETILQDVGINGIKVFAARTEFKPGGLDVRYIGPDGRELRDRFKEAHTRAFLQDGYRVLYVGNGPSDLPAARLAHHIFATGELLNLCRKAALNCTPFYDLNDVVRGLEVTED